MSPKFTHRLGLVLALLLVAGAVAAPAAFAQDAIKIAVIDVQKIITESQTGKTFLADLETYGKDQQAKLTAQKDEIDQIRNRISEGALSLSETALADLRSELESKTIALQRATDDAQREFRTKEQAALRNIEGKVMPVIRQIGADQGYTMIFRKFESGLIYADDGVDITNDVIQRLDSSSGS